MSYLKISNPTELVVRTGFLGEYYSIDAKETKSFPAELAQRFIETYPFLILSEKDEVVEKVKEELKEVKTTTKK